MLPTLKDPITVDYLKQHLSTEHPRLVYTMSILDDLKRQRQTAPVVSKLYTAIRLNADALLDQPLLTREITGRRLLSVSREMLYRVNMLGVVALVEEDEAALNRLNDEVLAVCSFEDWHPAHFLGVAEMALAVALALDWTADRLPATTVQIAQTALIEKGIRPSWPTDGVPAHWWVDAHNNWNQVCHGSMIAASLAVFETDPELAARTIQRALDNMPLALQQYAPDGVYPEGSSYWEYGTSYTVVTAAMLESALGTDFGLYDVPGLKESAEFRSLCNAPSGMYYNFSDCADHRSQNADTLLAWFAAKSGNSTFFEEERFLQPAPSMTKLERLDGVALAWIAQYAPKEHGQSLPSAWKGAGNNPVVIFKAKPDAAHHYYFAGKGGKASNNHGNMDAGSFVLELNGVRWSVDPGNQDYHELEQTGFNLWDQTQSSERWTLLTKNNLGHSTLTINDAPFIVDAYAPLIEFKDAAHPEAAFDLSAVYGKNIHTVTRRFIKDSEVSLLIRDHIAPSPATQKIVWQLITTAEVEPVEGGARLRQDGQTLDLHILSHTNLSVSVVSLDPPPLTLDRQIEGLKRLEIKLPIPTAGQAIDLEIKLIADV